MIQERGSRFPRCILAALFSLVPVVLSAQQSEPIAPFVVDLRGSLGRHKTEPTVASDLGVTASNLPTRTLGFSGGVHFYPLHLGVVTFGFGGHMVITRGSQTVEPTDDSGTTPTTPSPTVLRHFRTIDPEVSLNFGHRNGWSYISGGLGRSVLFVERQDLPVTNQPSRQTVHYGAGARWFTNHHIALSLDFRWYSVAPQDVTATSVAQPRTTLLVLSGGIGLR
jgi:hypothetical protein